MNLLAYLFLAFAVAVHLRFIPMPFHFVPIAAALLFFGARVPRKQMLTPLLLLVVSDIYLTRLVYGYPLTADHAVTWVWYSAMLFLGGTLAKNSSVLRVVGASLTASISFFLLSNFAVWAVWRDMYPASLQGVAACYIAALPFFRNTVISDLLFSAAFFGIGYLVAHRQHATATLA
jgi:hypothetical protein